mgnify:CR=1 FL=1
MADNNQGPIEPGQGSFNGLNGVQIEMVGRLVEDQ